jgi:hypothetical protein
MQRLGLALFMGFQSQNHVGVFWGLGDSCRNLEVIDGTHQPVFTDAIGINANGLS